MSPQFDEFLKAQMQQDYMKQLQAYIKLQRSQREVFPSPGLVLNAIKSTDYTGLKVVILGREPYCTSNTDMGLAFSCVSQMVPGELIEIQKEIRRSLYSNFSSQTTLFKTSNLSQWTNQGVLLINSLLTVESGLPGSHRGQGWEQFTIALLKMLSKHHNRLVFILAGKDQWGYDQYIDQPQHLVLKSQAPGTGKFLGSGVFSLCNQFITETYKHTKAPIDWHLLN